MILNYDIGQTISANDDRLGKLKKNYCLKNVFLMIYHGII